jgi:hypothetical protein
MKKKAIELNNYYSYNLFEANKWKCKLKAHKQLYLKY